MCYQTLVTLEPYISTVKSAGLSYCARLTEGETEAQGFKCLVQGIELIQGHAGLSHALPHILLGGLKGPLTKLLLTP